MKTRMFHMAVLVGVFGWGQWCAGQATRPAGEDGPVPLAVRWWGQACVSIETFWGFTIVIDPYQANDKLTYPKLDLTADLVLVTHNHFDHTGTASIKGDPTVLRGLTGNGEWSDWDEILDRKPNEPKARLLAAKEAGTPSSRAVHVKSVHAFHDSESGAERGKNTMFLVEAEGVRILHCGDLGHALTPEQVKEIGPIDLLLIPVGGTFTVDADAAVEVVKQLKPRQAVWPIHYKTDAIKDLPLTGADVFIEKAKAAGLTARQIKGNTIALGTAPVSKDDAKARLAVVIADYKPVHPAPDVAKAMEAMRSDRQALIDSLGKLSKQQLDHKPADGTHTVRWNFEHTTASELGFFSQLYHALDAAIPVLNWRPAQMPKDYKPRHPEWDTAEMIRHVQRVAAFTERFGYLLVDTPADVKVEGTRFSVDALTKLLVGHYHNHTEKAVKKFDAADWPKE